jgi:hypothetical protein
MAAFLVDHLCGCECRFNRYGKNEIVAVKKDSVILEKELLTGHNADAVSL